MDGWVAVATCNSTATTLSSWHTLALYKSKLIMYLNNVCVCLCVFVYMCVCAPMSVSSQRGFISLWYELQKDRPELLSVLEGILIHAVSQLQDCIRERDSLEQALRRSFFLRAVLYNHVMTWLSSAIVIPLFSVAEGKVNMTRWFGPYMKIWKARFERRERDARFRYRRVLTLEFLVANKNDVLYSV